MQTTKKQVLKFRCSDGLTTKPSIIRDRIVHEVRLPGSILFPDLCAAHFKHKVVVKLLRRAMLFAVKVLIELKGDIDEIILMAHDPCGTASILNMDRTQVLKAHLEWQKLIQKQHSDIPVRVMFEEHSACGTTRRPHFNVDPDDEMKRELEEVI